VAQHRSTGSEAPQPHSPRSSGYGSEPPSVEDDVSVWRYAILSFMPETTTLMTSNLTQFKDKILCWKIVNLIIFLLAAVYSVLYVCVSERVGWVPADQEVPEAVRSTYKWIEGLSVTEMEIMHGAYRKDNPNGTLYIVGQ